MNYHEWMAAEEKCKEDHRAFIEASDRARSYLGPDPAVSADIEVGIRHLLRLAAMAKATADACYASALECPDCPKDPLGDVRRMLGIEEEP